MQFVTAQTAVDPSIQFYGLRGSVSIYIMKL
jgi:hypothetical protein